MEILIQIVGTPFHQGMLILKWVPLLDKAHKTYFSTRTRATQLTYMQIEPSFAGSATMLMPFFHMEAMLDLARSGSFQNNFGYFELSVFNPLLAPTGSSTTISVSLFVRFPDAEFRIPTIRNFPMLERAALTRRLGHPPSLELCRMLKIAEGYEEEAVAVRLHMGNITNNIHNEKKSFAIGDGSKMETTGDTFSSTNKASTEAGFGGTFSSGKGSSGGPMGVLDDAVKGGERALEEGLSHIPDDKKDSTPSVKGAVSHKKRASGERTGKKALGSVDELDAYGYYGPAGYGLRVGVQPMAAGNMPGHSFKMLSLNHRNQQMCYPGLFGTDEDEMSVKFLVERQAWFRGYTWNGTATAGTALLSINVSPTPVWHEYVNAGHSSTSPHVFNFTPIEYVAMAHTYWRGTIVYEFQFVMTNFHKGKIWIGMFYGVDQAPIAYKEIYAEFGQMIDLSTGPRRYTIAVPYQAPTPWKMTGATVKRSVGSTHIGVLGVYIINPLVAGGNVSTSVAMNVYISGGEDFQVSFPSFFPGFCSGSVLSSDVSGAVRLHMGDVEPNVEEQPKSSDEVIVAKPMGVPRPRTPAAEEHFGECTDSMRLICKRYIQTVPVAVYDYDAPRADSADSCRLLFFDSKNVWSDRPYLCAPYLGFKGSMRLRLIANEDVRYLKVIDNPDITSGFGADFLNLADAQKVEAVRYLQSSGTRKGFYVASEVAESNAPYLELEIPFKSFYRFAIAPLTTLAADILYIHFFNLVVIATLKRGVMSTDVSGKTLVNAYMAFGDEAHYGGFVGIPSLTYSATWPAYVPPPAPGMEDKPPQYEVL